MPKSSTVVFWCFHKAGKFCYKAFQFWTCTAYLSYCLINMGIWQSVEDFFLSQRLCSWMTMIFSFFWLFWYGNGKQTSWVLLVKCQAKRKIYLLPAAVSSVFSWIKKDNHNEHNQAQIQAICGEEEHTEGENATTNWPQLWKLIYSVHTCRSWFRGQLTENTPLLLTSTSLDGQFVDGLQKPIDHDRWCVQGSTTISAKRCCL